MSVRSEMAATRPYVYSYGVEAVICFNRQHLKILHIVLLSNKLQHEEVLFSAVSTSMILMQ